MAELSALQAARHNSLRTALDHGRSPFAAQICPIIFADIPARLDLARLAHALETVTQANGALQAIVRDDGSSQHRSEDIPELYELKFPEDLDWTDPTQAFEFISREARYVFPRDRPMADVGWAISENRSALVLRTDQMISDTGSAELFYSGLSRAYHDLALKPAPDYFGLVRAENAWLASPDGQAELRYWSAALAQARSARIPVIPASPEPAADQTDQAEAVFLLGHEEITQLREYSRKIRVTTPTMILACVASALAPYADGPELMLPVRFCRRDREEVIDVIMWRDTHLPVIVPVSASMPLSQVLRAAQRSYFRALAHQRLTWPELVRSVTTGHGEDPLPDTVSLNYVPVQTPVDPEGTSFAGAASSTLSGRSPSDAAVDIVVTEMAAGMRVAAFFNPARVAAPLVDSVLAETERAIGNLLEAHRQGVDSMPWA